MDLLTEEEAAQIAEKAVGGQGGVRLLDYELRKRSQEEIGYLGRHLTLALRFSRGDSDVALAKTFFVKTYSVKASGEDFLGETGIFKREVDFYRIVAEDLRALDEGPEWCPKYFFSKERVLVLEDLSEQGFRMAKDCLALDRVHLEAALRSLAGMHAACWAFEAEEAKPLPAMFPTVLRREYLYDENKPEAPTRKWITWQIEDLLEGIEYLDKYSPGEKREIREKFRSEVMRIYPLSKASERYRNVLTHGDMWRNNILFRYSPEGTPVECRFVDFQFIRYAPPGHDVMHLLHYATKKETRDRDEEHYLRFYYQCLRERLRHFQMDAEKEMTGEEFAECCRAYKELALIQCLLSLHYLLGTVTLNADTETYQRYEDFLAANRKSYMAKFFATESYVDKIKDIFYELVDGYIITK